MDIPVNSVILIISAAILLVGIVAVSAFNGYAYNKKNLKKMLSQYDNARRTQQRRGTGRGNYPRGNYQRVKVDNNYNYYNNSANGEFQQQMNDEMNRQTQQQMNDEFNRQAMEQTMNEGWKSVTPFDHGGYVQGAGFNPSDTAAQQMNDMNNMNMGMF